MQQQKQLTDVHVHLDQYAPEEMEPVLRRADEARVRWIVTTGLDLATSARAVEIAAAHNGVLASVGIHPWVAAEDFAPDFHEEIRRLAYEDVTVAIGEVGLDFVIYAPLPAVDREQRAGQRRSGCPYTGGAPANR